MSIFQTKTICPSCGTEFTHPRWRPRQFCSRSCANKVNVRNLGEFYGAKRITLTCEQCGKEFTRNPSEVAKTVHHFCSQQCFGAWNSQNRIGERHPKHNRVIQTCQQCGQTFDIPPSWIKKGDGQFCSRECKNNFYRGKPAISPPPVMRGEKNPRWKGGYDPYYGPNWHEQRRKARKRDHYICQHCGVTEQETNRELDVHHIIPFRNFGRERYREANQLSNLLSLCQECHLKVTQAS